MPGIGAALESIDKFIKIGKEIAQLQELILPQYRAAAISLYQVCQKLLSANENVARWLYKFQYFDFNKPDAQALFLDLCMNYRIMKTGPERQALKFSCGDISLIYNKEIASKIGGWFRSRERAQEVEGVFTALASADGSMIEFIESEILNRVDAFEAEAETFVRANDMNGAEAARLRFKAVMGDLSRRIEQFSGELSDLVLQFARIGGIPVTLTR